MNLVSEINLLTGHSDESASRNNSEFLLDGSPDHEYRGPPFGVKPHFGLRFELLRMILPQLSLLVAFTAICSVILCLNAEKVGAMLGLVDVPCARKNHSAPTPLMGGVVLIMAFLPAAIVQAASTASERWQPTLTVWIGSIAAMTVIGLADDRHSLSPRARLLLSFLVFGLAAGIDPTFNIRLLDFEHPRISLGLGTWWLAIIFTVICCVGLINAVNMADGKNGLVIGLCIGWTAMLASRSPTPLLPVISLLAVMLLILFIFNLRGRIFLGDGGAYGLACGIGLLAVMIYNSPGPHSLRAISAGEVTLLFLVPVLDSFRLTYVRLKQGRSPMSPDRDHLHHHLQNRFGWPQGLLAYFCISFFAAGIYLAF